MRRLGTTDFGDEEIGADDVRYVTNTQTQINCGIYYIIITIISEY